MTIEIEVYYVRRKTVEVPDGTSMREIGDRVAAEAGDMGGCELEWAQTVACNKDNKDEVYGI